MKWQLSFFSLKKILKSVLVISPTDYRGWHDFHSCPLLPLISLMVQEHACTLINSSPTYFLILTFFHMLFRVPILFLRYMLRINEWMMKFCLKVMIKFEFSLWRINTICCMWSFSTVNTPLSCLFWYSTVLSTPS